MKVGNQGLAFRALLFLVLFNLFISMGCVEEKKAVPPDLREYMKNTQLMLNVSNKFINEPNVTKLHEVAVATQHTRAMACFDFNDECRLFGDLMSKIIDASADGEVSPAERQQLLTGQEKLRSAINSGITKLKKGH